MGYYRRRWRRHGRRHWGRIARYRISAQAQRAYVSASYGGIDADVRALFFSLDQDTLNLVFDRYEATFGKGKRKYAKDAYQSWRSGSVQMSGEVSARLIQIVPLFLNFEQKYDLIKVLRTNLSAKNTVDLSVNVYEPLNVISDRVLLAIDAVQPPDLSPAIQGRLLWLSTGDGPAAQQLLDTVLEREREVVLSTLSRDLRDLQDCVLANAHAGRYTQAKKSLALPGATVNIVFHVGNADWRRGMSDQEENSNEQDGKKELARVPFKGPDDLFDHALARMSPEQQDKVVAKATDEVVRLKVKEKEASIDSEIADEKLDQVTVAADRLSGKAGVNFSVEAEHRTKDGHVKVNISSPNKKIGPCFVATACYGDALHPDVTWLRNFRDFRLSRCAAGRWFSAWYYRRGPTLASFLAKIPPLKRVCRWCIHILVQLLKHTGS